MSKSLFLVVLALSSSIGARSQAGPHSCSATGNFASQSPAIKRTGVGTPYSLTAIIKTEMTLSNGNTLSAFTTSRQVMDSQGRTRVDEPTYCATDKDGQPQWQGSITVNDPVAKTHILWQENSLPSAKRAFVTHALSVKVSIPPSAQEELRAAKNVNHAYDNASPKLKHDTQQVEDLGKRTLVGLEASGLRVTRTSPSGMIGNSLPLTHIEEKWVSDRYGIILLDIKDDPIFGKTTYEVTNFTPTEPDAALFSPPAEYEISEDTLTQ